jgi:hypothetical protein
MGRATATRRQRRGENNGHGHAWKCRRQRQTLPVLPPVGPSPLRTVTGGGRDRIYPTFSVFPMRRPSPAAPLGRLATAVARGEGRWSGPKERPRPCSQGLLGLKEIVSKRAGGRYWSGHSL